MLPLVEELLPAPDPVDCCERLAWLPSRLFLDSARDPERLGRYSFVTADPAFVLRGWGAASEVVTPRGVRRVAGHPLAAARALLSPHTTASIAGLPPFQGGFAGYIGYDWGAVLERLPAPRYDDLGIPDVLLGFYDWTLAWDHAAGRAWLISTGLPETGTARERRAAERLSLVRRAIEGGRTGAPSGGALHSRLTRNIAAPTFEVPDVPLARAAGLRSSFTHRAYVEVVSRVREYIHAGDIFQANLSQRLEAPVRDAPWTLYRRLRSINPAPFSAFLDFGDVVVASASPERFLSLAPDGQAEARPIKGTRPRGIGPEHDAALGLALCESDKDRAENLMIVDLLRNDLSRSCAPGSVRVPELFALEHYATVHHLVSTVVGQLAPERDAVDLLCGAFPGGSITGAPKVRAMEIIAELEPSRRGIYCGAIGYLGLTGAMDTSIVIRTYLLPGGNDGPTRAYFSVGGGIVADSDPEQEYQETLDKARALVAALAA